jgi:hypothetical protein
VVQKQRERPYLGKEYKKNESLETLQVTELPTCDCFSSLSRSPQAQAPDSTALGDKAAAGSGRDKSNPHPSDSATTFRKHRANLFAFITARPTSSLFETPIHFPSNR